MIPDLSNYKKASDILPLLFGILTLDTLVLFLARAGYFGKALNVWYDRFGILAVLSDVLIILIGFLIARYVYALFETHLWLESGNVYWAGGNRSGNSRHSLFSWNYPTNSERIKWNDGCL